MERTERILKLAEKVYKIAILQHAPWQNQNTIPTDNDKEKKKPGDLVGNQEFGATKLLDNPEKAYNPDEVFGEDWQNEIDTTDGDNADESEN